MKLKGTFRDNKSQQKMKDKRLEYVQKNNCYDGKNNTEGAQASKTRQVSALCRVKCEKTNVISIYEEFYDNSTNSRTLIG